MQHSENSGLPKCREGNKKEEQRGANSRAGSVLWPALSLNQQEIKQWMVGRGEVAPNCKQVSIPQQ